MTRRSAALVLRIVVVLAFAADARSETVKRSRLIAEEGCPEMFAETPESPGAHGGSLVLAFDLLNTASSEATVSAFSLALNRHDAEIQIFTRPVRSTDPLPTEHTPPSTSPRMTEQAGRVQLICSSSCPRPASWSRAKETHLLA